MKAKNNLSMEQKKRIDRKKEIINFESGNLFHAKIFTMIYFAKKKRHDFKFLWVEL